jgi:hypothetical protein
MFSMTGFLPTSNFLCGDGYTEILAANRQAQRIAVHLRMPVDAANVDNFVAELGAKSRCAGEPVDEGECDRQVR